LEKGEGIHWSDLDADISADAILFGRKAYNDYSFEFSLISAKLKIIPIERLQSPQRWSGYLFHDCILV